MRKMTEIALICDGILLALFVPVVPVWYAPLIILLTLFAGLPWDARSARRSLRASIDRKLPCQPKIDDDT
jgi:hypothetical protein